MPGLLSASGFKHITIKELHPTFGAEVGGIDFSHPVTGEVFQEVQEAIAKYGVCVFRRTGLDDEGHVQLSSQFGELDDITPYLKAGRKNRLSSDKLFDVSNVDLEGNIMDPHSPSAEAKKVQLYRSFILRDFLVFAEVDHITHGLQGNGLFHVDSSFNPRRAGYSLLLAHELPPAGNGGNTEFADSRTAFDQLEPALKEELLKNDYIVGHSLFHSRKLASPEFFAEINPEDHFMSRHRLVQRHEPSGRMNLYIAAHAHHIEGVPREKSNGLLKKLMDHATRPENTISVPWISPGDMVLWDNTCVMHRVTGGSFDGKYKRDMRRTTIHDGSSQAWGLNEKVDTRQGVP